jgi:hypothetical protein
MAGIEHGPWLQPLLTTEIPRGIISQADRRISEIRQCRLVVWVEGDIVVWWCGGGGLLGEVGLSSDSRQLRYEYRLEYAKRPALLFKQVGHAAHVTHS